MVKRVGSYQFSNRFKKEYNTLPKEIQNAFDKKLTLFLKNIYHPSLRVKRIQGTKERWDGSITMKYRFNFSDPFLNSDNRVQDLKTTGVISAKQSNL